jgi:hypothetical protein
VPVALRTGPLEQLNGKQILVIADGQNLDHGAKDLGHRLSWSALRQCLESASLCASFHAVFARKPGDFQTPAAYERQGWLPCVKTVRYVRKRDGWHRDANADNLVAFAAGSLCSSMTVDLVLVGTGDGQLAEDVAEAISMLPRPCPVATLSLAGSTAARLDARHSNLIAANIEIGRDCLVVL